MTKTIAWINDFKISEFVGGCNITSEAMIKAGRALGHRIVQYSASDFKDKEDKVAEMLSGYDLLVINNISMFPTDIIEWAIKNTNYICYCHDYAFCEYRSAQCEEKCKEKCTPGKIFRDLYANSKLNIFFSPLQFGIHKEFFGEMMRDAIVLPAPLEEGKFYPDKNIQQDAYLFAGIIATHKGIHQILDYADTLRKDGVVFQFAGKAVSKSAMERIEKDYLYLGEFAPEDMPKLYRKYKHFVINPQMPETFGLAVVEAILSGCNVIKFEKSHKTGMESYGWGFNEILKRCYESPTEFWKVIDKIKDEEGRKEEPNHQPTEGAKEVSEDRQDSPKN
ncbi:MAG: glycosyltransferase family 4 protein [bacterium]|nr:glycosyltransferase family 4 protein [bacterium]